MTFISDLEKEEQHDGKGRGSLAVSPTVNSVGHVSASRVTNDL